MTDILVLGGTGTVGSRLATQLHAAGRPVRAASRRAAHRFDWTGPGTWPAVLHDVRELYLLLPDRVELPPEFLPQARRAGVRRVVLHSDRAVEIMGVTYLQEAERRVRDSGLDWVIVRPDWFDQNFETFLRQQVLDGRLCMPIGGTRQGFVDAGDIAAVAAAALTRDDLTGQVLEVTGPQALSFPEALAHLPREVAFDGTPEGYRAAMRADGLPEAVTEGLISAFGALAARGDTRPTGVVERVLDRPAVSFASYAEEAAARGVWAG